MDAERLRELRRLVDGASEYDPHQWCEKALAIIDAELALHSTAEIAGARAGEVCEHDWYFASDGGAARKCGKCGEVSNG